MILMHVGQWSAKSDIKKNLLHRVIRNVRNVSKCITEYMFVDFSTMLIY